MIISPILAATWNIDIPLLYPIIVTPKFDGIRALKINNILVTRKFLPIKNKFIIEALKTLPNNVDGELICGDFQNTTSLVMTEDTLPNNDWYYQIFDYIKTDLNEKYIDRINNLNKLSINYNQKYIKFVTGKIIYSLQELISYESEVLNLGYEGIIIRSINGPYKCGRSTLKEGYLLKFKRFSDDEAKIVDFIEYKTNNNKKELDVFGHIKKSSKESGRIPANMLGKFILETSDGKRFGCGSGFTTKQRKEIWLNKEFYIGQYVKYKYFKVGTKNLPRHPVFLGFRHIDDLDIK